VFGIVDSGALAGVIELSNLASGPFQSATVGYWVDDAHRGRGLATRGVAAIVELAFGELGLHRLEAATLVDNLASQRVLERTASIASGSHPAICRSQELGATTCSSSGPLKTSERLSRGWGRPERATGSILVRKKASRIDVAYERS
jgi:Acetyltransferase (GNAT) domain